MPMFVTMVAKERKNDSPLEGNLLPGGWGVGVGVEFEETHTERLTAANQALLFC